MMSCDECSTGAFVVLLKLLLLLVFQQIANFRKQFFFVAGFCWWLVLRAVLVGT